MLKKTIAAILFGLLAVTSTGCESHTEFGECVGINQEKDPDLKYKTSTLNVVLGVIFVETIIVPVIVLLDEFECPVGRKAHK